MKSFKLILNELNSNKNGLTIGELANLPNIYILWDEIKKRKIGKSGRADDIAELLEVIIEKNYPDVITPIRYHIDERTKQIDVSDNDGNPIYYQLKKIK